MQMGLEMSIDGTCTLDTTIRRIAFLSTTLTLEVHLRLAYHQLFLMMQSAREWTSWLTDGRCTILLRPELDSGRKSLFSQDVTGTLRALPP